MTSPKPQAAVNETTMVATNAAPLIPNAKSRRPAVSPKLGVRAWLISCTPLNTVQEISHALTPSLGETAGRLLFALGMSGAALVATIVVSLTAAWGLGEVMGYRRS